MSRYRLPVIFGAQRDVVGDVGRCSRRRTVRTVVVRSS